MSGGRFFDGGEMEEIKPVHVHFGREFVNIIFTAINF